MKVKVKAVVSSTSQPMKDTGVDWLGKIPGHWKTIKLCYITSQIFLGSNPVYSEDENECYIIGQKNNQETGISFEGLKYGNYTFFSSRPKKEFLAQGDILLNTLGTGSVGRVGIWNVIDDNSYITDGHIMIIRCVKTVSEKYYYYVLSIRRKELEDIAIGSTNQAFLTVPRVYKLIQPFPPLDEQKRIVSYLDEKCARIDSLIEKTRESIEEYKKLKQSIITEAVTKGIRPNREMKDSGVEWVGLMPADWETINPKALFALRKDKACPGERQLTSSQQYGIVYQDEYMGLTGNKVVTVEKDFDILKHVENGDFVISMRSFQGGIEYSTKTGSISSAYVMLVPNLKKVFPRYYRWLFKSAVYIDALQTTTNMVRDGQAMRYSHFAKIRLMVLPKKEQEEIADYLDEYCAKLDCLIDKKEEYITQVEAYKKSLIYEYVTGKKEAPMC